MTDTAVGIDLGGTKIFGARIERRDGAPATVVDEAKQSTPTTSVDDIVAAVVDIVRSLAERPDYVGIGTPGVVAPGDGTVEYAPNLAGFDRPVPLARLVSEAVGVPVAIGNDVNMAALGEARVGAAAGVRDVLAVWMGTGLGAGLVLDGRLRVGPNGLAGELGHAVVVPDGRLCFCGGRGHVEAYIGRRALEDQARRMHEAGRDTVLVEGDKRMKSKVFASAYENGDEVAVELIDEGLDLLAVAVANVLVIADVETVVVGGGLGERLGTRAVERLRHGLDRLRYSGTTPRIVAGSLGDLAGALGAAFHAAEQLGLAWHEPVAEPPA